MPRLLRVATVVGTVAACAAVVALAGIDARHRNDASDARYRRSACARTLAEASRMSAPLAFGAARVDLIGDSYSVGARLADPRTQSWAALLARRERWQLRVHGVGSTGFVNAGPCGGRTYATRVDAVLADHPVRVLIEGGLNDVFAPGDVRAAAAQLLARFPSSIDVVVIGPTAAPAHPRDDEVAVDAALRSACATAGRPYVSTLGWQLTYADDQLHLDPAGDRVFAAKLAAALA